MLLLANFGVVLHHILVEDALNLPPEAVVERVFGLLH
jgi:hypothetical protein